MTQGSPLHRLLEAARVIRSTTSEKLHWSAADRDARKAATAELNAAIDALANDLFNLLDEAGLILPRVDAWINEGMFDEAIEARARALGWTKPEALR